MPDVDRDRLERRFRAASADVLVEVELETLGTDYGATGYTDRAQADEIGDRLGLTVDSTLLDLGSGCGWPGLGLAARHGCRLVTVDPVEAGVRQCVGRAELDGVGDRHLALVGDGGRLPLASRSVDAVVHVDVLC